MPWLPLLLWLWNCWKGWLGHWDEFPGLLSNTLDPQSLSEACSCCAPHPCVLWGSAWRPVPMGSFSPGLGAATLQRELGSHSQGYSQCQNPSIAPAGSSRSGDLARTGGGHKATEVPHPARPPWVALTSVPSTGVRDGVGWQPRLSPLHPWDSRLGVPVSHPTPRQAEEDTDPSRGRAPRPRALRGL